MGLTRFHGKALRFNGLTDGLVVPTGKYRESGVDLRESAFAATVKMTKSHATKVGRKHIESLSNPLNALRGAFTIDAYIIPDYGGVIVEKPGSFRLKYGEPFSTDKLIFEIHTNDGGYTIATSFDIPVKTESNSGVYSSSSNAHRPQDFTVGEQGLVLVTAQYTQKEMRCFINGDIVCKVNLGGAGTFIAESSSDIFIGGKGGEFRGIIESVRITSGEENPVLQPLTKTANTFGLWEFDDEYDTPNVYFFDDRGGSSGSQSLDSADRQGTPQQGRDGPDTHDGLLDTPMVAIGYDFATNHFKIRDYPDNPSSVTDRYSALEKLASLTQGIPLEEVKDQTWYATSLDLTDQAYFTGTNSTVLNAVINHSGTSPITGIISAPDTQKVQFSNENVLSESTTSTLNPSMNRVERIRITGLDFANGRVNCTSVHLTNDTSTGGADNLPTTQGHVFSHTDNTPVWFTLGKADLLIDPGNETISGQAQRVRAKDTFTLAQFTQGQRFSDASGYSNDAYFFSTQSRSTDATDANTLYDPSTTYAGMGAVSSYTLIEGDFFLKMLPIPDKQQVKQTIQGIANTFLYEDDDLTIQSLVSENQKVRVTEPAYHGEITKVINKTLSVGANETFATGGGNNAFNRIVVEHGVGHYETALSQNISASTRDEIVAIAVSDPKPFMLKGLDIGHTADISGGVPTNDNYIRHLTPEKNTRIATIDSSGITAMISAGGPKRVLVYYDAIDLTGEIVAGTGLANADVSGSASNSRFRADHATGNAAYLVVRKTVPCGSAIYGAKTLSAWLRRPYTGNQTSTTTIALTITAPGGLISLPTTNFKEKPASHILSSNPTGDITPSPFLNIEDTVYSVGDSIGGYGRPKPVPSINTPDDTSNADYHLLVITSQPGNNRTSHKTTRMTPSAFRRSNLCGFDVIDNDLTPTDHFILVQPSNRSRYESLSDVATNANSPRDKAIATLEKTLMRGRIEEINPEIGGEGESKIEIRGRSLLMDIIDHRSSRDFNLGQGTPVKEIGDMGTPTVTMTLGGLGQGGIDIQPTYAEHPFLPGWKDKIVGAGNASVRNDKQTSTYYASTRALTEIPLFPSMFYDVDKLLSADNESRTPLPSNRAFKMTVDCTMATNRPEMRENESRFAVDWGQNSPVASFEITDQLQDWIVEVATAKRWLIRCQRPSVQAVVASYSSGTLTVDDASAFNSEIGERGLAANCAANFYVTIGEGVLNSGYGIVAKAAYASGTTLTITTAETWNPLNTTSNESSNLGNIDAGMTVTLGGFVVIGGAPDDPESPIIFDYTDANIGSLNDVTLEGYGPTLASAIATAIRSLMGLNANAVHVDPDNPYRYLILDGPNMEAFEWDPLETHEAANDRQTLHPIICRTSHLALKGKKSAGTALEYVRPLEIDFSDIALKKEDFRSCVNEVIRRINMAGHPQAKNSAGGSAFDPPPLFPLVGTNTDTGTHMGHVRAFFGSDAESRDGEDGTSIVIHSTIPGASGRNFNVRLSNKTPYAYKPAQVVGYGGLLSTNSRLYQPNSFPAPMPIGADGETFVPVSTFMGAPSGSALNSADEVRSYNGLGSTFKVTTVVPTTEELTGAAGDQTTMTFPTHTGYYTNDPPTHTKLNHLAVSMKAEDYIKRTTQIPASAGSSDPNKKLGILMVDGMIADFLAITQHLDSTKIGTNCFFIHDVTPRGSMSDFIDALYDQGDDANISGVEVQLIYPGVDSEGIVYFGGGHTGVTFDISDGTANDYSNDFSHHYSTGPTGFSGFQNLHEVSTASAVLDFTDITDSDTINDNTLRGLHHKLRVASDGSIENSARLFARLNETAILTTAIANQGQLITEDLYGSYLRLTRGFDVTTVSSNYSSGSTLSVADSSGFESGGGNAITGAADAFSYTGTATGQLTGVSLLSAVNAGVEIINTKTLLAHTMVVEGNGPAQSADASSGGLKFTGFQAIGTHYWTGSTTKKEYGPMGDFDCTEDFSISVWFNPNQSNLSNDNSVASGPLISGRDTNGKYWGLYLMGSGVSSSHQTLGFAFKFDDGSNNNKLVVNEVSTGSIQIPKDTWTNIIVTKTGADTVTMHCGNSTHLRFNNSGTSDQTALVNLGLGSPAIQGITRSLISGTTHSTVGVQGTLPKCLGLTTQTGMCFIGLSALKNLKSWGFSVAGGGTQFATNGVFHNSQVCGTTDGAAAVTSSFSGYAVDPIWAWNITMGEIGLFDHALSSSERDEIFAARGVW